MKKGAGENERERERERETHTERERKRKRESARERENDESTQRAFFSISHFSHWRIYNCTVTVPVSLGEDQS